MCRLWFVALTHRRFSFTLGKKSAMKPVSWILLSFFVIALAVGCLLLESHARNEVTDDLISKSSDSTLRLESVNLSSSYYIYFTYELEGVPELTRAYWRLKPFNQIDVEK